MSGVTSSFMPSSPSLSIQAPKKGTYRYIMDPPPPGNGKTLMTPVWTPALHLNPSTRQTYIIDGLGLSPRYFRTTLADAHSWAQTYDVYDGSTSQCVLQLPPSPMANPSMPAASAEADQTAGIVAAEKEIASGWGPVGQQYNAIQIHRRAGVFFFFFWGNLIAQYE